MSHSSFLAQLPSFNKVTTSVTCLSQSLILCIQKIQGKWEFSVYTGTQVLPTFL